MPLTPAKTPRLLDCFVHYYFCAYDKINSKVFKMVYRIVRGTKLISMWPSRTAGFHLYVQVASQGVQLTH